jgi:hypothetical protein
MRKRCDGETAIVDNRLLPCSDKVTAGDIKKISRFVIDCHMIMWTERTEILYSI